MIDRTDSALGRVKPDRLERRGILAGVSVGLAGWLLLGLAPWAEVGLFAHGTAVLTGLLTGSPVVQTEDGWLLAGAGRPVLVSSACSATGYFLTVAVLLGWQLGRRGSAFVLVFPGAILGALPVTLLVNTLRVVALAQAHRWIIPHFPESYGPMLHLLTGVSVFLPALIGLNLLLDHYGNGSFRSSAC